MRKYEFMTQAQKQYALSHIANMILQQQQEQQLIGSYHMEKCIKRALKLIDTTTQQSHCECEAGQLRRGNTLVMSGVKSV